MSGAIPLIVIMSPVNTIMAFTGIILDSMSRMINESIEDLEDKIVITAIVLGKPEIKSRDGELYMILESKK